MLPATLLRLRKAWHQILLDNWIHLFKKMASSLPAVALVPDSHPDDTDFLVPVRNGDWKSVNKAGEVIILL